MGQALFDCTVSDSDSLTSLPLPIDVSVGTTISSAKGAAHSLSFIDANGGLETVSLNVGSAQIFFSGNGTVTISKSGKAVITGSDLQIDGITLTGTTKASSLSLHGTAAHPATVSGTITDTDPLGSIIATATTLTGNITLDSLEKLQAGSISLADFMISSTSPAFSFTAGAVTGSTIYSSEPITNIKVASWTTVEVAPFNGQDITAPSISTISCAGDFDEGIVLTTTTSSIKSINIAGTLGGRLGVISVGSLVAKSVDDTFSGPAGSIGSFTVRSGLAASLTCGAIGSLVVDGDLTGNITASSAKLIRVSGAILNSIITIPDTTTATPNGLSLGQIVAGSMVNSWVLAGIEFSRTVTNTVAVDLLDSPIQSIRLVGRSGANFTNSNIYADKIGSLSLGKITTDNSGYSFGITTQSLGSFTGVFGKKTIRPSHADLLTQSTLQKYLTAQAATLGDFSITIQS